MPQLKVQNYYEPTITAFTGALGDATFTLSTAPTYSYGYFVLAADNINLREIVYYHDKVGNVISVRAENRGLGGTTPKQHGVKELCAMKDVAEIFNFFSDNISQCFNIEKIGGLTVKVWGGTVFYNGAQITVADTNLTLADNTTNYVKYTYPTNAISFDGVNAGNIKAIISTLGGVITSITYKVAKESFIDFTVSLTGALPSQAGNGGKSLITDGTNVSWGTNNNLRTSQGLSFQNLEIDGATGNEVKKSVGSGTTIALTETIRKRKADTTYEEVTWSNYINNITDAIAGYPQYIAGEDLSANDWVTLEEQRGFFYNAVSGFPLPIEIGVDDGKTRTSIDIIGNGVSSSSIKLGLAKVGSPADSFIVRIETSSAGKPSGTLVDPNATATIASGSITGTLTDTTINFAGSFTMTNNTLYHVVMQRVTAVDSNYYIIGGYTWSPRGFKINQYTGTTSTWGTAGGIKTPYIDGTGFYKSLAVKTNASDLSNSNFIGSVLTTASRGTLCTPRIDGTIKTFSGLTSGGNYYLSNTPGTISTTPGTVKVIVGIASNSTSLRLVDSRVKTVKSISFPQAGPVIPTTGVIFASRSGSCVFYGNGSSSFNAGANMNVQYSYDGFSGWTDYLIVSGSAGSIWGSPAISVPIEGGVYVRGAISIPGSPTSVNATFIFML